MDCPSKNDDCSKFLKMCNTSKAAQIMCSQMVFFPLEKVGAYQEH